MRKTKIVSIPSTGDGKNRDAGKHFFLTEMDADQGERWAARAFFAMAKNGADIPPELMGMGMGAIVAVGIRSILTMAFEDAMPLLDEMMQCVQIVPDPRKPDVVRAIDADDIEEVSTRLLLRSEVFELHTGFSPAAFLSELGQKAAARNSPTQSAQTSPESSPPS